MCNAVARMMSTTTSDHPIEATVTTSDILAAIRRVDVDAATIIARHCSVSTQVCLLVQKAVHWSPHCRAVTFSLGLPSGAWIHLEATSDRGDSCWMTELSFSASNSDGAYCYFNLFSAKAYLDTEPDVLALLQAFLSADIREMERLISEGYVFGIPLRQDYGSLN